MFCDIDFFVASRNNEVVVVETNLVYETENGMLHSEAEEDSESSGLFLFLLLLLYLFMETDKSFLWFVILALPFQILNGSLLDVSVHLYR